MIFAKVDVKLRDHIKAHRAGPAMATWTWALLYAREQETDGIIYAETLRGAWVGESLALEHAAKLVEVGLWEVIDDGWRIRNYSAKNETKAAIDEKRRSDRDRKRIGTARPVQVDSERNPIGGGGDSVSGIPGSGSYSGSGSGSPEGVQGEAGVTTGVHVRRARPDPMQPAPDWWAPMLASIAMDTGVELPERESWTRYAGHRGDKGRPAEQGHAVYWLTTVMVGEARKAREEAARQRERDEKFDRQRAGPLPPTEQRTMTEAEQRELAAKVPMRRRDRGAA